MKVTENPFNFNARPLGAKEYAAPETPIDPIRAKKAAIGAGVLAAAIAVYTYFQKPNEPPPVEKPTGPSVEIKLNTTTVAPGEMASITVTISNASGLTSPTVILTVNTPYPATYSLPFSSFVNNVAIATFTIDSSTSAGSYDVKAELNDDSNNTVATTTAKIVVAYSAAVSGSGGGGSGSGSSGSGNYGGGSGNNVGSGSNYGGDGNGVVTVLNPPTITTNDVVMNSWSPPPTINWINPTATKWVLISLIPRGGQNVNGNAIPGISSLLMQATTLWQIPVPSYNNNNQNTPPLFPDTIYDFMISVSNSNSQPNPNSAATWSNPASISVHTPPVSSGGISQLFPSTNNPAQLSGTNAYVQWADTNQNTLYYQLQISSDSGFSHILADQYVNAWTSNPTYGYNYSSLNLAAGTQYYWRVRTVDPNNINLSWSTVFTFTTIGTGANIAIPLFAISDYTDHVTVTLSILNGLSTTAVQVYAGPQSSSGMSLIGTLSNPGDSIDIHKAATAQYGALRIYNSNTVSSAGLIASGINTDIIYNSLYTFNIAALTTVAPPGSGNGSGGGGSTTHAPNYNDTALEITDISPNNPKVGEPFNVTVRSVDTDGNPSVVGVSTVISLDVYSGNGRISGTISGSIPSNQKNAVFTGVKYDKAESGVILRVKEVSGDSLGAGLSNPFNVSVAANTGGGGDNSGGSGGGGSTPPNTTATKLEITSIDTNGGDSPLVSGQPFNVRIAVKDANGNATFVRTATLLNISVSVGTGTLTGSVTGTIAAHQTTAVFSGVIYSKPESGVVFTVSEVSGDNLTSTSSTALTFSAPVNGAPSPVVPHIDWSVIDNGDSFDIKLNTVPTGVDTVVGVATKKDNVTQGSWYNIGVLSTSPKRVQKLQQFGNDQIDIAVVGKNGGPNGQIVISGVPTDGGYSPNNGLYQLIPGYVAPITTQSSNESGSNGGVSAATAALIVRQKAQIDATSMIPDIQMLIANSSYPEVKEYGQNKINRLKAQQDAADKALYDSQSAQINAITAISQDSINRLRAIAQSSTIARIQQLAGDKIQQITAAMLQQANADATARQVALEAANRASAASAAAARSGTAPTSAVIQDNYGLAGGQPIRVTVGMINAAVAQLGQNATLGQLFAKARNLGSSNQLPQGVYYITGNDWAPLSGLNLNITYHQAISGGTTSSHLGVEGDNAGATRVNEIVYRDY